MKGRMEKGEETENGLSNERGRKIERDAEKEMLDILKVFSWNNERKRQKKEKRVGRCMNKVE